ncbi:MAG: U32 family peptidase [Bryobacterales bacterium]|nr:U32 family peptidase [Bryobacterales bacterium]
MKGTRDALAGLGWPSEDPHPAPASMLRFPDGAQYRIEIPSTEGPSAFAAVLEEADRLNVPVHRVSQGSGIMLLSDGEIREMLELAAPRGIEVNLFVGPRATFDIGAQAYSPAGKALGLSIRGSEQLVYAVEDVRRAAGLGIRSVLVSDTGLLAILGKMRRSGDVPGDLILKTSVMMAPANAAAARVLEDLGASTINVPSDLTLPQLASIRAAVGVPIDLYVEAPDNIGGFVRHYEVPELIRVGSPLYVKLGLRNAPDIYPSGSHIESTAVALSRERVRRARLVLDMIRRYGPDLSTSAAPRPPE